MSLICIIFDRLRTEEKLLKKEAVDMGHEVIMTDAKTTHINTDRYVYNKCFGDIAVGRCISYFRGLYFTACLEFLGVQVINKSDIMNVCGNKLLTSLFLKKHNIATPKTYISFSHDAALEYIEKIGYPLVIKPVIGSWGRGMALLKDKDTVDALIDVRKTRDDPNDRIYYLQEFVKRPPRDIRVITAGENILAAMYRKSAGNNLRTNIARGASPELCKVTNDIEDICTKTSKVMGKCILGIDIMEDEKKGLVVHEINNTVEFSGLMTVTNTNIPKEIIKFVLNLTRK